MANDNSLVTDFPRRSFGTPFGSMFASPSASVMSRICSPRERGVSHVEQE
jgi:hypothetical protein